MATSTTVARAEERGTVVILGDDPAPLEPLFARDGSTVVIDTGGPKRPAVAASPIVPPAPATTWPSPSCRATGCRPSGGVAHDLLRRCGNGAVGEVLADMELPAVSHVHSASFGHAVRPAR